MLKLVKYCIYLCALSLSIGNAQATMIPVGIDINGSLTTNTVDGFGNVSSTGSVIVGGVSTGTDISAGGFTADTFTDIGDGLSLLASVLGSGTDGVSYNGFGNNFLVDIALAIANTTADTHRVTLDFGFNIFADAGGAGLDSFIESILFLNDGIASLFSEDYTSDTAFNDIANGVALGTSGDAQGNAGSTSLIFDIAAGATLNIIGQSSLRGGAYNPTSDFTGDADFSLTIASIENLNSTPPPNPVPEPLGLTIFALGLALIIRKQLMQ